MAVVLSNRAKVIQNIQPAHNWKVFLFDSFLLGWMKKFSHDGYKWTCVISGAATVNSICDWIYHNTQHECGQRV